MTVWRVSAYDRSGRQVASMDLSQGEITIGRDADRQMVLPSASVSRRHARVLIQDGRPCVIDDGSSNGVIVDGVRIGAPTAIGPASQVDLAEFRLTVEPLTQTQGVAPLPPPNRTQAAPAPVRVGPTLMPAPLGGPAPAVAADIKLVGESGVYRGREFPIGFGTLSVGRSTDNDLVFDDPSLSRKHARIIRDGARLEVEDLGSSNGTFVNGRRVGKGAINPGDQVRFGDVTFRVDGPGAAAASRRGAPGGFVAGDSTDSTATPSMLPLAIGGGVTLVLLVLAVIMLFKKPPTVPAPGREAIAKIQKEAEQHLALGKKLYREKKYADAKEELDQAVELDPANAEARKLRLQATHGADDDRLLASAQGALSIGDRKGIEAALKALGEISDGSTAREQLLAKIVGALVRYGSDAFAKKDFAEAAWGICKAYELAPVDGRPDARALRTLREAEKKLKHNKSYVACTAAPR
jgi:pSer/pThr/pTyr-binding forkhead associated (FHA) protein